MCGRYFLDTLPEFLIKRLRIEEVEPFPARYNIAPSQDVMVARAHDSSNQAGQLTAMRWGLVPFWAKDEKIGNRLINARSETAAEKPAFRAAWRKRRALVPMSGFYEWVRHPGGGTASKQPYAIYAENRAPFAVAALWERWDRGESPIESVCLLTLAADPQLKPLHHRMPVVVNPDHWEAWLSGSVADAAACISAEAPIRFAYHPVSTRVNRPANTDAELLDEVPQEFELSRPG